ncbi:MAG: SemiSWEET transporter [Gammaproteobacteria bacterium]|nr:SemiSWEET transporter [Gammaproteobacteria bacterium]
MSTERLIGLAAAALTTVSFAPQVWRSWRSRDTRSTSLPMYAVFTVGVGLWLIYGLMLHDLPITLANAITLVLALAVLVLKLRYG